MSKNKISVKVLTWEAAVSIEKAALLKAELLDAFDKYSQVVVSMSLVENLDISAMQLLKSAHAEAVKKAKSFHLTGALKKEVSRALILSGFIQKPSDNARDIEEEYFGPLSADKERNEDDR
ncbi:hypothetical protein MASR2M78_29000 [Treponema sp.]